MEQMEEISTVVRSVMQRDRVRPDADLFDLGATSLTYVRIIAEINERYGLSLNGSEVNGVATIERLAGVVAASLSPAATSA